MMEEVDSNNKVTPEKMPPEVDSNKKGTLEETIPEKTQSPVQDENGMEESPKTNGVVDKPPKDAPKQPEETQAKDPEVAETEKKDDANNVEKPAEKKAPPTPPECGEKNKKTPTESGEKNKETPIEEATPEPAKEDSQPKKSKKVKIESKEIVDGLEMCVEFGSETSSSEPEEETIPSKSATEIVKVIPNESEVDNSDHLPQKLPKKRKRYSKRIRNKSTQSSDSDAKSDENLHDRIQKSILQDKERSASSDDSDVNLSERLKLLKKPKPEVSEDEKRIRELKDMLKTTGLMFTSYRKPYGQQDTDEKRITYLEGLLKNRGIEGVPTFDKCEEMRRHLESKKEVAELDLKNIIAEGRRTRPKRFVDVKKYVSQRRNDDDVLDSDSE